MSVLAIAQNQQATMHCNTFPAIACVAALMQSTAVKTKSFRWKLNVLSSSQGSWGCSQKPEEASIRVSSVTHVNNVGPVFNSDKARHIKQAARLLSVALSYVSDVLTAGKTAWSCFGTADSVQQACDAFSKPTCLLCRRSCTALIRSLKQHS